MTTRWINIHAVIAISIVILLFVYIGVDCFVVRPRIRANVEQVEKDHNKLSKFLNKKIPQIDSTLKVQTNELLNQKKQIEKLNTVISEIRKKGL